eukprot:08789.XXX_391093_391251_1 [CDS] Oithona nana genome sequencing.
MRDRQRCHRRHQYLPERRFSTLRSNLLICNCRRCQIPSLSAIGLWNHDLWFQ